VHLKERVRAYFDAANGERWDEVVASFHDDAVLEVPAQPARRGVAEIRRFYEAVPRLFPEHYDDPVLILAEGDDAVAAIDFRGRTPDGRAAHFWAADKFRFEDGRIRELRIIFDPAGLRGTE
jgi:ketosteroid isomerase-like protein